MEWLTLANAYYLCAVAGGTVMVVQFVLLFIGLDGSDHDGLSEFEADEAGEGGNFFFAHLSLKTVVAFLTFFGLTGMLTNSLGTPGWLGSLMAFGAGLLALYLVAFLMSSLHKLHSEGNLDLNNAVGSTATVYLKIPASGDGAGKVTVTVQDRTVEARAVTSGEEIPTGAQVLVVAVEGEVFEVSAMM